MYVQWRSAFALIINNVPIQPGHPQRPSRSLTYRNTTHRLARPAGNRLNEPGPVQPSGRTRAAPLSLISYSNCSYRIRSSSKCAQYVNAPHLPRSPWASTPSSPIFVAPILEWARYLNSHREFKRASETSKPFSRSPHTLVSAAFHSLQENTKPICLSQLCRVARSI